MFVNRVIYFNVKLNIGYNIKKDIKIKSLTQQA